MTTDELIDAFVAFFDARKQLEDTKARTGVYSLSDDEAVETTRKELNAALESAIEKVARKVADDRIDAELQRGDYDPDM